MLDPFTLMLALATPSVVAAPATADDFRVTLGSLKRKRRTLAVEVMIDNRIQAPRMFVHLEPGNPPGYVFTPAASGSPGDRSTYYLANGDGNFLQGTLAFPLDASAYEALLVVGEAAPPYRQRSMWLELGPGEPDPSPTPAEAAVPPGERVIARYKPPMPELGDEIQLRIGKSGPDGSGWARIYTAVPEVTLDQVKATIERPQQIWLGWTGQLFLYKLSAARALAVAVTGGQVVHATLVTKTTLAQAVGPNTEFPRRIYPR